MVISSTREGLHVWGSGRESDPYESALPPPWLPAASSCSATASAVPRQRGCSLVAFVVPTDLAHILPSANTANTFTAGSFVMTHAYLCEDSTCTCTADGRCMALKRHAMHSTCCSKHKACNTTPHSTPSTAQQNRGCQLSRSCQLSSAQHSTAQHSTAQHSTAQHNTAQQQLNTDIASKGTKVFHTAQHSTKQHSTAHRHTSRSQ